MGTGTIIIKQILGIDFPALGQIGTPLPLTTVDPHLGTAYLFFGDGSLTLSQAGHTTGRIRMERQSMEGTAGERVLTH